MMEDAGYGQPLVNSAVAAGSQQSAAEQLGAEQGYNAKLQRDLCHAKIQLDDMQKQYQVSLSFNSFRANSEPCSL
jgi:hypothetical protein